MSKIAVAEQVETAGREIKPIPTGALKWQSEGFLFRHAVIRLPRGIVLQDLHDHADTLFKSIQGNRDTSLREDDCVTFHEGDRAWTIPLAMVDFANDSKVLLSNLKPVSRQSRVETFEDDKIVIRWDVSGFAIFRKSDDVRLANGSYPSVKAAEFAYYQMQPRKVG